jgi:glycosyltransferase involved in cell wall biosynthesis
MPAPSVSIVINNYNYERFLPAAIESALSQSYAPIEVLVVDDGSTDRSREVIAGYGARILPVLKHNGGQASAFNAGVGASRGQIICLLDADDLFHPDKVSQVVEVFRTAGEETRSLFVSHWLDFVDAEGDARPGRFGNKSRRPLNLYDYAKRYGFTYSPSGPTSGISFNRALAERIFPLPESGLRVGADDFVRRAASLIADCHAMDTVLASYRVHGNNRWYGTADEQTGPIEHVEQLEAYLNELLVRNGLDPVIRFRKSMYFCTYLAEQAEWRGLTAQIARALLRHPDLHTARFTYELLRSTLRRSRARKQRRQAGKLRPGGPRQPRNSRLTG